MYKIGVIGDPETVAGFSVLGCEAAAVENADQARVELSRLVREASVIFVVDWVAKEIEREIHRYRFEMLPAIVIIPGVRGNLGLGRWGLRQTIKKAIGADLLADERKD
jgi:V/A-type H+-transporting ATPase subunit F